MHLTMDVRLLGLNLHVDNYHSHPATQSCQGLQVLSIKNSHRKLLVAYVEQWVRSNALDRQTNARFLIRLSGSIQ